MCTFQADQMGTVSMQPIKMTANFVSLLVTSFAGFWEIQYCYRAENACVYFYVQAMCLDGNDYSAIKRRVQILFLCVAFVGSVLIQTRMLVWNCWPADCVYYIIMARVYVNCGH